MTSLRANLLRNGHKVLLLLLAVLGMQAFVPAGHMVAPSGAHGIAITLCPTTHPLARAIAHRASDAAMKAHAAMGHMPASPEDDATPATTRGDTNCAFSALASAALEADRPILDLPGRDAAPAESPALPELGVTDADRLRPPLRAPPFLA